MSGITRRSIRTWAAIALASACVAAPVAATAQDGFFGSFFGMFGGHQHRSAYAPRQDSPYIDPRAPLDRGTSITVTPRKRTAHSGGGTGTYCVRLCDGRYFPISTGARGATEACNAMCPAAETEVFRGGSIENAVAKGGKRYSALANAFAFREKVVSDCACKKDGLGTATMKIEDDPTLRPGDIVATEQGLVAFNGRAGSTSHSSADFTPVDKYTRLPTDLRKKLATIDVQPSAN